MVYQPYNLNSTYSYGTSNFVITITTESIYTQTTGYFDNYPAHPYPVAQPEPEPDYSLEPKTPPGTRPAWDRPQARRPPRVCAPRIPEAVRWRLYARRCLGATTVRPVAPVR